MSVPTIQLTGPAVLGFIRAYANVPVTKTAALLPVHVKLGRVAGVCPEDVPRFESFFAPPPGWKPPESCDHAAKAGASIARMFANDRYGCCVISDRAHSVGVWTANDSDSGGEVLASDNEVISEYHRICGRGDNGCMIEAVLREGVRNGYTFGGRKHRLAGYVRLDARNPELVRAACHLFGPVAFGVNFRDAWRSSATWGPVSSPVVGGHDVGSCGYRPGGFEVMSWGRKYFLLDGCLEDPSYVDECYAMLSVDWTNSDRLAPSGVDVDGLVAALERLGGGVMPDPHPPGPHPEPPVPPPPGPTWPGYTIEGRTDGTGLFTGVAVPTYPTSAGESEAPCHPDEMIVDCPDQMTAAALSALLWPVAGLECEVRTTTLYLRRGKLSPEQWSAIIAAILAAVQAIIAATHPT